MGVKRPLLLCNRTVHRGPTIPLVDNEHLFVEGIAAGDTIVVVFPELVPPVEVVFYEDAVFDIPARATVAQARRDASTGAEVSVWVQ